MAKTYLPTLIALVHRLHVYIAKHEVTIRKYLTPEQQELLSAVAKACQDFKREVPPYPPEAK